VGTTVEIWLPVANRERAVAAATPTRPDAIHGAGVVLLVDDEDLVRTSTAQMLADLGYEVVEASSGKEALAHLDDPRISLIVTDHLMPDITGTEFAREVQARSHPAPILLISGYAELDDIAPDLPRLTKPFRESELSSALVALAMSQPPK
jgi:CheY-like chemotaxis protein